MPENNPVIAVTSSGAYKFTSLEDALAHPMISLADPIFSNGGPIDVTLIRGPGLEGYTGQDPWKFLDSRAVIAPVPVKKAKRKKGSSCGE